MFQAEYTLTLGFSLGIDQEDFMGLQPICCGTYKSILFID